MGERSLLSTNNVAPPLPITRPNRESPERGSPTYPDRYREAFTGFSVTCRNDHDDRTGTILRSRENDEWKSKWSRTTRTNPAKSKRALRNSFRVRPPTPVLTYSRWKRYFRDGARGDVWVRVNRRVRHNGRPEKKYRRNNNDNSTLRNNRACTVNDWRIFERVRLISGFDHMVGTAARVDVSFPYCLGRGSSPATTSPDVLPVDGNRIFPPSIFSFDVRRLRDRGVLRKLYLFIRSVWLLTRINITIN